MCQHYGGKFEVTELGRQRSTYMYILTNTTGSHCLKNRQTCSKLHLHVWHRLPYHPVPEVCTVQQLDIPDAVYTVYTTGWCIISPITHTARSTEARLPHCVRSRPALYRAQRLARRRMSSTLQIWGWWPLETSSVSMLMILTSSSRLPTNTLNAPSLTTYNIWQTPIT